MSMNLGVRALLSWVNSLKLTDRELNIEDLQDGTRLLQVVYMLKKEANPFVADNIEDRFKLISEFLERDCRFSSTKGISLFWDNIRAGINLTVEIGKVLLLLVYHDMMNDKATLNILECDVEREIANLTSSYVMESEGCVYLNSGIDTYLIKKYLPVSREMLEHSASISSSTVSSVTSLSDDESPVFHRTRKINFVDMQTVASSSVSKSPLQDIMNTPKFQMRKMQRQMIKERDYRDGLERELASKMALIAQRESHINQLQYRLDKLKEEQGDREQVAREQINKLETKNNMLQMRFDEILRQNKDFKGNSSLMERKVDELTEENGVLSSQVRAICSQLAIFKDEISRLKETQASAQEDWKTKTDQLQSELDQATAEKELLTEQNQILQGKISCLEDEINSATQEEVGENMWPVMEREMLRSEINTLKCKLESSFDSLKKAEDEVQAKTQQLAVFEKEMTLKLEALRQQCSKNEDLILVFQQENEHLKVQLEQVEQQKTEQIAGLQDHITACEKEIENHKELNRDKEYLLNQAEAKVKDLLAKETLLADKEVEIFQERKKFQNLIATAEEEMKELREQIQAKEEELSILKEEGSIHSDTLQHEISLLKSQLEDAGISLSKAEEKVQTQVVLLTRQEQENAHQKELLQQQLSVSEAEVRKMKEEIQTKEDKIILLKTANLEQSDLLQQEIQGLQKQVKALDSSLRKAEDDVQSKKDLLAQQQQEAHLSIQEKVKQEQILQKQICLCEEEIQKLKETQFERENLLLEAQEKLDNLHKDLLVMNSLTAEKDQNLCTLENEVATQANLLQNAKEEAETNAKMLSEMKVETSKQIDALQHEIQDLKGQLESITVKLTAKENLLLETQKASAHQTELLQKELTSVNTQLNQQIDTQAAALRQREADQELHVSTIREKEALLQEKEVLTAQIFQAEKDKNVLEKQVESLVLDMERLDQTKQAMEKENQNLCRDLSAMNILIAEKEQNLSTLENEVASQANLLQNAKEEAETNAKMLSELQLETSKQIDALQHEIQDLKGQLESISVLLSAKEKLLIETQQASAQQTELLQKELTSVHAELNLNKDTQAAAVRQREADQELHVVTIGEKEALLQEKEVLTAQIFQAEKDKNVLEKQVESLVLDMEQLDQTKQAMEKENQNLCRDLSVINNLISEKDENLGTLEKKVASQANLLQNAKEEAETNAKMLSELQLDTSKQIDSLQHEIQDFKGQLESISIKLSGKEKLLIETQQASAQQIELLQKELTSMNVELNLNKDIQAAALRQKETDLELHVATKREKEALFQEKEVLMAQIIQADKDQKILQKQVESLALEKEGLDQTKQALETEIQNLCTDLSAMKTLISEKDQNLSTLQKEVASQANLLQNAKEKAETNAKMLSELQLDTSKQMDALQHEIQDLKGQLGSITVKLTAKERLLLETQQASAQQTELLQKELTSVHAELNQHKDTQAAALRQKEADQELHVATTREKEALRQEKEGLTTKILKAEKDQKALEKQVESLALERERLDQTKQAMERDNENLRKDLSAMSVLTGEKEHKLSTLEKEVAAQANLLQNAKVEAETNAKMLSELQLETSKQIDALQHEIQDLKGQLENVCVKLLEKEKLLLEAQHASAQQTELLQKELTSVNAELNQHKNTQAVAFRQKVADQELHVATTREKEALLQEKDVLMAQILQTEKDQKALEKEVETLVLERERLVQTRQAMERENEASRKLESVLQHKLELMKLEKETLVKEIEKYKESEQLRKDLQEQLAAKSEAAEHYKAQMEKAVSHYNDKKQLLHDTQEEVAVLKHSLEVREREMKAAAVENKLLQLDLDKAQNMEKTLLNKVASLEAQLAFADHNLRQQNRIHGNEAGVSESRYLEVPKASQGVHTKVQVKRTMSSDSLDQSSLEDSLNTTRKLAAPDESSTPLVRSSERLAAKCRGLKAESLETLYFTPITSRHRTTIEHNMELDSAHKNPTSSVKRRRTTQVINITLTKKTPGSSEDNETFYSLASARSQPNLSSAHTAKPLSMELFDTPARKTGAASDQLVGLPGYRRSTIHSQTSGTFCVGEENEPDGAPEDWMRIAELQARNKACLPHLKSSYPLESETGCNSAFMFTDEELRTGDPTETIRRASVMPGQLHDSLTSHRLSLMMGQSGPAAGTRSHRMSLMPGQLPSKTVSSSQLRSPKCTKRSGSTLSVHQSSPEKKVKASCFPRPLTPKNKNVNSGPSNSQIHPVLSPGERRQSMMFSIDNTPKHNNYLKKGLNKLRSSTRKSPGKNSKMSPAHIKARKENLPSGSSRPGMERAGRSGKSPLVTTKDQRKTPQVSSRTAKSPGLTASARKMMSRMKV
ncbi:uncharacterized protein ACBR49_004315 [Aulostomus maculatus]